MKRILLRASKMCPSAALMLKRAEIISCIILFCALVVLFIAVEHTPHTHYLYIFAEKLYRLPAAALFIAVLGSAIIEDFSTKE